MTPSVSLRSAASRAVETALSSPQSQHVRRCVPRGLTARLASPLPTHLLRICAGALLCPEQWGISKFASGQSPTSSRQGGLVCGALRLPHDLMRLPLLFPQNSLRDFCGSPEKQESTCSPLAAKILRSKRFTAKRISPQWEIPCEQMAKSPPGSLQESICSHSICLILEAYCH